MKIKRYNTRPARIEMLPLIDIVFLLLVFFIYAMLSMTVHQGMQLDLPESSQATKTEETPLTLSLRTSPSASTPGSELDSALEAELEIFLNKTPMTLAELRENLPKKDEQGESGGEILVFAEENVSYQALFQVLDELKQAGMTRISLQANPE
jgi:biopolymer transport protein ExbD